MTFTPARERERERKGGGSELLSEQALSSSAAASASFFVNLNFRPLARDSPRLQLSPPFCSFTYISHYSLPQYKSSVAVRVPKEPFGNQFYIRLLDVLEGLLPPSCQFRWIALAATFCSLFTNICLASFLRHCMKYVHFHSIWFVLKKRVTLYFATYHLSSMLVYLRWEWIFSLGLTDFTFSDNNINFIVHKKNSLYT
jgi:hypothetical protein